MKRKKFHINVVVEVDVFAEDSNAAASKAEEKIQRLMDRHAKSMNAVAGADYGDAEADNKFPPDGGW